MNRFSGFILCFIAISPVFTSAQRPITRIDRKIDTLQGAGIDSILLFAISSIGWRSPGPPDDLCQNSEPRYLIWRSKEKVYFQKFMYGIGVHCYSMDVINNTSSLFGIFTKHVETIERENTLPFIAKMGLKGKEYYQVIRTFHPLIYEIFIYYKNTDQAIKEMLEGASLIKRIDTKELEKKLDNWTNLNYNYNISTKLVLLLSQILTEVSDLENKKRFNLIAE